MKKIENNYNFVKAGQTRKSRKSRRSYSPSQLLSGLNKAINIEVDTPEQSEYDDPGLTKFVEKSDLAFTKKESDQIASSKQINIQVSNESSKLPERSNSNRETINREASDYIKRSNSANTRSVLKDESNKDNLKISDEISKKSSKKEQLKPKLQVPRLYANQPQKIEQPVSLIIDTKLTDQKQNNQFSQEYKFLIKKLKKYLIIFTICIVLLIIIGIVLSVVLSVVINKSCWFKKCNQDEDNLIQTNTQKTISIATTIESQPVNILSTNELSIINNVLSTTISIETNKTKTRPTLRKDCQYGFSGIDCEDECGKTFVEPNLRIVGGIEAIPNSWPWTALVCFRYRTEQNPAIQVIYYCGGTLIDRVTILTVAHCIFDTVLIRNQQVKVVPNKFYPTMESMYKVYLGLHDRTLIDFSNNIEFNIDKIIKHENYNPQNDLNDIAILKLDKYVDLSERIQIACLPNTSEKYPRSVNISAWVMGWGSMFFGGQIVNRLRNVRVTVYEEKFCSSVASSFPKNWNSQLCAGEIEGGKDSCQGDSGNSLLVTDLVQSKKKFVAAGIVSYGEGCALPNKPGIYTRISYFLDWIKSNSG